MADLRERIEQIANDLDRLGEDDVRARGVVQDLRHALAITRLASAPAPSLAEAPPCFFVWASLRRPTGGVTLACDALPDLPEHAWCPACRYRAALASPPQKDTRSTKEG